jgi:hypothetical protein
MSEEFNQSILADLEKIITKINPYNQGNDILPVLNNDQKLIFVNIVREYYRELANAINSNRGKIRYDGVKFIIPITVSFQYGDNTRTIDCKLTGEQFIQAIVDALVIDIFRLEGKQFNNTSGLLDEYPLKEYYPYILAYLYNEIVAVPGIAAKVTQLAAEIATVNLPLPLPLPDTTDDTSSLQLNNNTQNLVPRVLPPTPPGGWPSDKRGGKTNRKRKYKMKYKMKSRSRCRSNNRRCKHRTSRKR